MKTNQMKISQALLVVGTLAWFANANAQTAAPKASVEAEVAASQQYVDGIMGSMGQEAQSSYDFSADYKLVGPGIQTVTKKALQDFREFMGVLGISSGLSSAVKTYNDLAKSPNVNPSQLEAQYRVIEQQVGTAETLYQAAIASLYRLQPNILVDRFYFKSGIKKNPGEWIAVFADLSETNASKFSWGNSTDPMDYFPSTRDSAYRYYEDFDRALISFMKNRYSQYMTEVCGSKYCITNVLSSWSRYYANVDELVNRDLKITLADGKAVSVLSLKSALLWRTQYQSFQKAITEFHVGNDFLNLKLKLLPSEWPVQPTVQN